MDTTEHKEPNENYGFTGKKMLFALLFFLRVILRFLRRYLIVSMYQIYNKKNNTSWYLFKDCKTAFFFMSCALARVHADAVMLKENKFRREIKE